jgi:hypothetical protein
MMGAAPPQMPPGMEGAPPFPQGGADNAPPTPDGLPPLRAAAGSFVANMLRGGYDLGRAGVGRIADEASMVGGSMMNAARPYLTQADEYFGRMLPPSMRTSVMRGEDGRPVTIQGRESIVSGPGREPMGMGEGTRLTQGRTIEMGQPPMSQVVREQIAQNPGATKAILGGGALGTAGVYGMSRPGSTGAGDPNFVSQVDLIDQTQLPRDPRTGGQILPPPPGSDVNALAASQASNNFTPIPANSPVFREETTTSAPKKEQSTASFINAQLKKEAAATPEKDFNTRVKENYNKLEPTFREILGDNKDDIRTNALLLIADAGFKFASNARPTMAAALADAVSGLPKGFAALFAQARERNMKIKTSALQQAVDNVNLQDKYAMQHQLELLKARTKKENTILAGDYRLLEKQIETGGAGGLRKDGGMGLENYETKNGSLVRQEINPESPVVQSAIKSRFTLRDTDNPFVENRGPAPTTLETDKGERVKLGNTLRSLDNSLSTLDNLKGTYSQVYGGQTWFNDKVNNLFVPVIPGNMVRPDVNLTDASTRISTGMNTILKNIASANDGGRVAVQEQEWARETAKGINDPTAFFSNKEIAAKQFSSMEAMLRNARQQVLTQLGFEGNDYVMSTPNTGTQNDPFTIPADPEAQKRMFTFLGSTIGTIQDPRATVYVKMPNGTTQAFNPTALRGLIGK